MTFRTAVRALARTPGFSITVILTLAVGIGVATAMFTVVNGVLFRALPFPNPEDLYQVEGRVTRSALATLDPTLPVAPAQPMAELVSEASAIMRVQAQGGPDDSSARGMTTDVEP